MTELQKELVALIAKVRVSGEGFNDCNLRLLARLEEAFVEYALRYSAGDGPDLDEDNSF